MIDCNECTGNNCERPVLAVAVSDLKADVERLTRERDEAMALVETMRVAAADLLKFCREDCGLEDTHEMTAVAAALATTGPAALAEVRARLFMEAAEMVGHVLDKPEERTARAMAVMTLKGCALNERGAAAIRAEAQG